jgi:hypothetical protein
MALADTYVIERYEGAVTRDFQIRDDNLQYLSMVENGAQSARPPYRYRVLSPWLASLLPTTPATGLWWVTHLSLFVTYLLGLALCRQAGIGWMCSGLALLALVAFPAHTYQFHNPFLTDAAGLAMLTGLLASAMRKRFAPFLAIAIVAPLARETTCCLLPLWVLRDVPRGLIALVAGVTVAAAVWVSFGPDDSPGVVAAVETLPVYQRPPLRAWLSAAALAWSFGWPLAAIGVLLLRWTTFVIVMPAFVLLATGAALATLFATDIERMFGLLAPVMLIGFACGLQASFAYDRTVAVVLTILVAAQFLCAVPSWIVPYDTWRHYQYWPPKLLLFFGTGVTAVLAFGLRRQLSREIKYKWRRGVSAMKLRVRLARSLARRRQVHQRHVVTSLCILTSRGERIDIT